MSPRKNESVLEPETISTARSRVDGCAAVLHDAQTKHSASLAAHDTAKANVANAQARSDEAEAGYHSNPTDAAAIAVHRWSLDHKHAIELEAQAAESVQAAVAGVDAASAAHEDAKRELQIAALDHAASPEVIHVATKEASAELVHALDAVLVAYGKIKGVLEQSHAASTALEKMNVPSQKLDAVHAFFGCFEELATRQIAPEEDVLLQISQNDESNSVAWALLIALDEKQSSEKGAALLRDLRTVRSLRRAILDRDAAVKRGERAADKANRAAREVEWARELAEKDQGFEWRVRLPGDPADARTRINEVSGVELVWAKSQTRRVQGLMT